MPNYQIDWNVMHEILEENSDEQGKERAVAETALVVVRAHLSKSKDDNSAELAASDAQKCFRRGDFRSCYERALASLKYSSGINHEDYKHLLKINCW